MNTIYTKIFIICDMIDQIFKSSKLLYHFIIFLWITLTIIVLPGCKNNNSSHQPINPDGMQDYLTVISHTPLNNEVVFADSTVSVTFSHEIDMSTVNASTFYVLDERSLIVNGTYEYIPASKTLRFIPVHGFEWGSTYTVYVTTGIYNTLGLHMQQEYSWSFAIAPFYDTQKPRVDVSSVQPVGDNVSKNAIISFTIIDNGHIDISSIAQGVIIKDSSGQNIEYTYTYIAENKEIRCAPIQSLIEGQVYLVSVTNALHDEAGNPLENPYTWQFTVQAIPPQVLSINPADGQTNVSIGEYIQIVFSEPVMESTLLQGIKIEDSYGTVPGTIQYNSETSTVTFIPDNLEFFTDYIITVTTNIRDINGIPLDRNYTSTFRTMQENIQPEIISITPASPIDVETVFQIQFSEPMDEGTLYSSVLLCDSYGNYFPVTIDYDEQTYCCTVTPDRYLTGFYQYIVEITTGATDIHGNPLIQQYSYTYSTNPAPTDTVVLVYMPADYSGGDYIAGDISEMIQTSGSIDPSVMRTVGIADYPYDANTQLFEGIYGYRRDISLQTAGFAGNELNTALAQTVSQLLSFVNSNYLPQQIIFVLLDRKTKPMWCIAEDETSNARLLIHDFADAVRNNNISVLVLDAPVKSTVEVGYEFRNSKTGIEYIIASQGEVLSGGFNYTALLNAVYTAITTEPPPDNMTLAIAEDICRTTVYPVSAGEVDTRSLALVDLQQIEVAASDMNAIVSECQNIYDTNPSIIDAARFAAHFYYSIPWYADLVEFLQSTDNVQLQTAAGNFSNCVLKKVMPLANIHSGLSIMFTTKTHESWYISNLYSMDFVRDYSWDEFLQDKHIGLYIDPNELFNNEPDSYTVMLVDGNTDSITINCQNYFHDPYDADIYSIDFNYRGGIYRLTDNTVNTINSNNDRWQSITASQDGAKLAAAVYDGYIYTSGDGGTTWVQRNSLKSWTSITGSQDGTKLAATVYGGYIYTSGDSGTNWTQRSIGPKNWMSISCSQNGSTLAAAAIGDYISVSTNQGGSWSAISNAGQRNWSGVAVSYDGGQIAAVADDGIYIIKNQNGWGVTDIYGSSANWTSIAGCGMGDGFVIVAAQHDGYIYLSKVENGVRVWKKLTGAGKRNWESVSIAPDSTRIIAIADRVIVESDDQGQTWYVRYDAGMKAWSYITYAWAQNAFALVSAPVNSNINGLLTVSVGNVPENCEYVVRITDDNGSIINESDRSGPGGTITLQQIIQTNIIKQYYITLIPVNISMWTMNTKQQYTVQFNYQKN